MIKWLARMLLVMLALVTTFVLAGYVYMDGYLNRPLTINANTPLDIAPGTSAQQLAEGLAQRGWIEHPELFSLYMRFTGDSGRIRAGEYEIPDETNLKDLLTQITEGRVFLHSVTILEGWTFRQMLEAIQTHEAIEVQLEDSSFDAVVNRLQLDEGHPEGLFFPDTYRFAKGTSDVALLSQSHNRMKEVLATTWQNRQEGIPLTNPYEALILASIIEKETGLDSERAEIAGVFTRRLKKNMRLQTDPTVIYGLGESFDGDIKRRDLQTDTPYNTYTRGGLPPTPIALPGQGSLAAAVNPAEGSSLFFVATGDGDGSHKFSDTLEEHNQAVQDYLRKQRRSRDSGR